MSDTPLPVLLRKVCTRLLGAGCPPPELIAGLLGAAVDLSRAHHGPDKTRDLMVNVALTLDEALNFPEDSANA